jgi:hypothetical protein
MIEPPHSSESLLQGFYSGAIFQCGSWSNLKKRFYRFVSRRKKEEFVLMGLHNEKGRPKANTKGIRTP